MPSARAIRCNLRLRSDFRFYPYRLQSLALLARCACQEGSQVRASIAGAVPGGTAEGVRAGGNKYSSDVMVHRATRAHCANPASGGVLHSAALRCGRDSE